MLYYFSYLKTSLKGRLIEEQCSGIFILISLKNGHGNKLILYFSKEKGFYFPEEGIEMLFIIIRTV